MEEAVNHLIQKIGIEGNIYNILSLFSNIFHTFEDVWRDFEEEIMSFVEYFSLKMLIYTDSPQSMIHKYLVHLIQLEHISYKRTLNSDVFYERPPSTDLQLQLATIENKYRQDKFGNVDIPIALYLSSNLQLLNILLPYLNIQNSTHHKMIIMGISHILNSYSYSTIINVNSDLKTFDELERLITEQQYYEAENMIISNPSLLLQTNILNESLLHTLVTKSDVILQHFLDLAGQLDVSIKFTHSASNGFTPAHVAVKYAKFYSLTVLVKYYNYSVLLGKDFKGRTSLHYLQIMSEKHIQYSRKLLNFKAPLKPLQKPLIPILQKNWLNILQILNTFQTQSIITSILFLKTHPHKLKQLEVDPIESASPLRLAILPIGVLSHILEDLISSE